MSKTRVEKIDSILLEIQQLENKRKKLLAEQKEQDRRDRTKRLCKRMGLFESMLPDTIPLTDEQFKTFLEKTVTTDHSRRVLSGLAAQNAANPAAEIPAEGKAQAHAPTNPKPPRAAQGSRTDEGGSNGDDTKATD
jgi:hypothetical protein